MGKTLNQLLDGLVEEQTISHIPSSILVECGNCGNMIPAAAGTVDVLCPGCKVIEDTNNEMLTSSTYHLQRNRTKVRKKVGNIIPAVHHQTHFDNQVEDRT